MIKFLTTDVFRMSAHDFCVTKTQVVGVICVLQKHLCMVSVGVICVLCVTETPVYGDGVRRRRRLRHITQKYRYTDPGYGKVKKKKQKSDK